MIKLNDAARATLRGSLITPTEWAREYFNEPTWHGDACGCPDDHCIEYHHGLEQECQCILALLDEWPLA